MHHTALGDFRVTVENIVAEGDKVALHLTWGGTHKGEFAGIAPTGKQATMTVINIYRVEGGKIAEQWAVADMLGLMQQLGAVPPPG